MQRLALPTLETKPGEIIIAPQPGPQTSFLACSADVVIYGGAAGGGKTWGLLLDALRYAALEPVSGFGAVIFRRTAPQIKAQGGLWDEAAKLYPLAGGKPNKTDFAWDWPTHGTRIRFAHMQYDDDMYNWQGSQIPYLAFDELTHFGESAFFYMLSRNRSTCGVKPRVRATVNPDPDSWVKAFLAPWVDDDYPWHAEPGQVLRFYRENDATYWLRSTDAIPPHIKREHLKTATFIPARLADNPALIRVNPEYEANLMALPRIERERLLGGPLAWKMRAEGNVFKREWFKVASEAPYEVIETPEGEQERRSLILESVRYWDIAATEAKPGTDPDWTVGVLLGRVANGNYYVLDVVRERRSPKGVKALLIETGARDGRTVRIRIEQEPGSSGKAIIDEYVTALDGYDVRGVRSTGNKETHAAPFSAQVEAGHVFLLQALWNAPYINELCAFPTQGIHDDQVDGSSGAYEQLRSLNEPRIRDFNWDD
jgi:predicted phage terminase large subunit-like protein